MNITKIVDLSMPIGVDTPVYPGDPTINIEQAASFEKDGFCVSRIKFGSHSGTHVDAPFHINAFGKTIDEMDLSYFVGTGVLIDVTGKKPEERITLKDVEPYLHKLKQRTIALFYTGWSKYYGDPLYFRHPYLDAEMVQALLDQGVRTFFIDALNIDPPTGEHLQAHQCITKENGIIGENFINFDQITFEDPFIVALPLKMPGLDGSPVRAVAMKTE